MINNTQQLDANMKNFELEDYTRYDPYVVEGAPESYYDTLGALDAAIDIKTLYDGIFSMNSDDYFDMFSAIMESMGLGSLMNMIDSSSFIVADFINNLAKTITMYGGPILERLALLGILKNNCATNLKNNRHIIRLHRLALEGLFRMLACYGLNSITEALMDILAPFEIIVIVPENTTGGIYTPAVTKEVRNTDNAALIGGNLNYLLEDNSVETILLLDRIGMRDVLVGNVPNITRSISAGIKSDKVYTKEEATKVMEFIDAIGYTEADMLYVEKPKDNKLEDVVTTQPSSSGANNNQTNIVPSVSANGGSFSQLTTPSLSLTYDEYEENEAKRGTKLEVKNYDLNNEIALTRDSLELRKSNFTNLIRTSMYGEFDYSGEIEVNTIVPDLTKEEIRYVLSSYYEV